MEAINKKRPQRKQQNLWTNAKTYRIATQSLFFALTVYFFTNFIPNIQMMLTLLALILATTVILRAGFCGWICPFGTIIDAIRSLGKSVGKIPFIKPINKKYNQWIKKNRPSLNKVDKYARYFRYILLLWILQIIFFPTATVRGPEGNGMPSFVYWIIGLQVLGLFNSRAWCKYACPVGGLIGIISRFSPTHVTRNQDACINCKKCSRACPMGIEVANLRHVNHLNCNTCLICVDACPIESTLELRMNSPFKNQARQTKQFEAAQREAH